MRHLRIRVMVHTILKLTFLKIRMPVLRRSRRTIMRKQENRKSIPSNKMRASTSERAGAPPNSTRPAVRAVRSKISRLISIRDRMKWKSSSLTKIRSASISAKFRARSRKRSMKSRESRSWRRISKSTTSTSTRSSTPDRDQARNRQKSTS